jgi:hypothetical protein
MHRFTPKYYTAYSTIARCDLERLLQPKYQKVTVQNTPQGFFLGFTGLAQFGVLETQLVLVACVLGKRQQAIDANKILEKKYLSFD